MQVSRKLIENVGELKKALNEISVYDFDVYTSMELYYKIANKLNEVIKELSRFEGLVSDEVIKQNEKLIYLLGEGLNTEVVKKINQMVADGTMDTIINHNVFNSLNNKIEDYKDELSSQIKDVENNMYVSVKTFHAKGDGLTDDTLAFNQCVKYCIENKKGMFIPQGTYLVNQILVDYNEYDIDTTYLGGGRSIIGINIRGEGDGTIIKSCSDINESIFKFLGLVGKAETRIFLRHFTFENFRMEGQGHNKRAFEFHMCQYFHFNNVTINKFHGGGMYFNCTFDCNISHVNMGYCSKTYNNGLATYPLYFEDYSDDNVNAIKFSNCRIEGSPTFLYSGRIARNNYFVNCKFEKSSINLSTNYRPFYFVDNLEGGFMNCMFVSHPAATEYDLLTKVQNIYFEDNNLPYFLIENNHDSASIHKMKFIGCDFVSPDAIGTRWIKGTKVLISDSTFMNALCYNAYSATNDYIMPFELEDECTIVNTRINAVLGTTLFNIKGKNNKIDVSLKTNLLNQVNRGLIKFNENSDKNIIIINNIDDITHNTVFIPNSFISNNGYKYLKDNCVKISSNKIKEVTSLNDSIDVTYGYESILVNTTGRINLINYGSNNSIINIISLQDGVTVNQTDYLKLKNGTSVTLNSNSSITLKNINGVWYEIS